MRSKRFLRKHGKLSDVQAEEATLALQPSVALPRRRKYVVRRVVGDSMYPTLQPGELVIARRKNTYSAGDIIVFEHKGLEKIKRVRESDGTRLYVIGDNPNFSTDSRHYGMIFASDVLGAVLWPRLRN